ncbi:MAG: NUDIX hydrolase [Planctomycetota bacterium]|jgi:8-oxo-dGTP pyrophosphatase MutT (NUDIX family)
MREVREECGCGVVIRAQLGEAVQHFTVGNRRLELRGTFYEAVFEDDGAPGSGEHELQWHNLPPEGLISKEKRHA